MIRSLKHYFERKNEFYTEKYQISKENNHLSYLLKKLFSTLIGMEPLALSKHSQLRVCCVHKIWKA